MLHWNSQSSVTLDLLSTNLCLFQQPKLLLQQQFTSILLCLCLCHVSGKYFVFLIPCVFSNSLICHESVLISNLLFWLFWFLWINRCNMLWNSFTGHWKWYFYQTWSLQVNHATSFCWTKILRSAVHILWDSWHQNTHWYLPTTCSISF